MKALAAVVGKVAFGGDEATSTGSIKSSSSSSGGKGSGSGGGYNADYSSSECSSDTSLQGKMSHMLVNKSAWEKQQDGESIGESTEHARGSRLALHVGQDLQQSLGTSNVPNKRDRASPATTTDALLEALQKSFLGHGSLPPMEPSNTTPVIQRGSMPQLNGVRIQHPMDPRIDLTTVGHIPTGHDPGMPIQVAAVNGALNTMPAPGVVPPSMDHYMHMLEAVRPFFSAYGLQQGQQTVQQQNGGSGSDVFSSEGFTSFFTTTNSNTTTSDSNSDSRGQPSVSKPQDGTDAAKGSNAPMDESDASSMVVLARVKRKHLKKQADQRSSSSTSSAERPEPQHQHNVETVEGDIQQELQPQAAQEAGAPQVPPPVEGQQESSFSSSSSEAPANNDAPQGPLHIQQDIIEREGAPRIHHYAMPPRIVSESSDRQSSATSNVMTTTTSGSGTGSGSGGNSGSGSANGSSGSGNEGKGSSTDNAKGENSAGDVNSNSDENITTGKENKVALENDVNAEHWKAVADVSNATGALHRHTASIPDAPAGVQPPTVAFKHPAHAQDGVLKDEGKDAVREKKLQDKKRKRMNMRREYEEQVQQEMESSESSAGPSEIFLKPGKSVVLDEVLSFSKTAR